MDPIEELKRAFHADDAAQVRRLLDAHPEFKTFVDKPVGDFGTPAVTQVKSREMLDVLLAAGADINARSTWWAGGFGLLDCAAPDLAAFAIERGARVDAHSAARLGLLDRLCGIVARDPAQVRARGGDGQLPLHFASTVEIADFLLDHGADIDARDIDHESTAAQYMIKDRQEIARRLVARGCSTDILLASALGDRALVERHLDADPECIRMRVSDEYFPMLGGKTGGTIYQWTLGWHDSAHQVAKQFGHNAVYELLLERSPPDVRVLVACWEGNQTLAESLAKPGFAPDTAGQRQVAHAARNNNLPAVRAMLAIGFPVDAVGQHGGTPLHWAAFHGNAEMVLLVLRYNPPLNLKDSDFKSTPLGWAKYGSEHGWHSGSGDYPGAIAALQEAGARDLLSDRSD